MGVTSSLVSGLSRKRTENALFFYFFPLHTSRTSWKTRKKLVLQIARKLRQKCTFRCASMQVVALQKICGILKETPSFFHAHASNNELHPPPSCPRDFCIPWLSRATARDEVGFDFDHNVWLISIDQVAMSRVLSWRAYSLTRRRLARR